MSNGANQDRERNVRDQIATIVQAHVQARRRQGTDEEIQTLRRAVGRLDQPLADAAADEQARANGRRRGSPSASSRSRTARSATNGHRKEGNGTRIEAATPAQEVIYTRVSVGRMIQIYRSAHPHAR